MADESKMMILNIPKYTVKKIISKMRIRLANLKKKEKLIGVLLAD